MIETATIYARAMISSNSQERPAIYGRHFRSLSLPIALGILDNTDCIDLDMTMTNIAAYLDCILQSLRQSTIFDTLKRS